MGIRVWVGIEAVNLMNSETDDRVRSTGVRADAVGAIVASDGPVGWVMGIHVRHNIVSFDAYEINKMIGENTRL